MKWLKRAMFAAVIGAGSFAVPASAAEKATPAAATQTASEVEVLRDVAYGTADAERQKLDLYLPKGKKDFPVVVFLHGGGFNKGDRKEAAQFGESLAAQGVGVAAVGYRLYPQAKHPAQVQDAAKAIAWVKKNVAERGGNPDRLFVAGHSAGGLLAALVASDEQYLKAEGVSGRPVAGVISLSGGYRVAENRKDVFGEEDSRKAASPISHVRAGLPPFLLVYADKDQPGKDQQTREYADALKGVGVPVEVVEAKDRNHGTLFTAITAGDPTGNAVLAFVRTNLNPSK